MRRALIIVVAALLAIAAYWPGLQGPFLFDDFGSVLKARPAEASIEALYDVATGDRAGPLRRPVANLSFALNHLTTPGSPLAYKITNLVIHLLLAGLLFLLARCLLRLAVNGWTQARIDVAASIATLVWLLHPIQVSTVSYIVQRMTGLAALFSVAALLVALRFLERPAPRVGDFVRASIGYWLLVALAIGSKETGTLVPLLLLAVMLALPAIAAWRNPLRRAFALHAAVVPVLLGCLGALWFFDTLTSAYDIRDFTLVERLATQTTVLWFYLSLIAWPDPRRMGLYHDGYATFGPGDPLVWLAIAGLLALLVVAWWARRRQPLASLAILWFLAAHALESTFVPLELVFEHRNYLALFGPALLLGAGVTTLVRARTDRASYASVPLMLVLTALTAVRSHAWSSDEVFASSEARNRPESPRAQLAMAALETRLGRLDSATARIERIKAMAPRRAWPWLLDANLQCSLASHPVDWDHIDAVLANPPIQRTDFGALRFIAQRFVPPPGDCPDIEASRLERAIGIAANSSRKDGKFDAVERLLLMQAQVVRNAGDERRYLALLEDAANANPRGTDALFALGYVQLNAGRLDAATATAGRIWNRIESYDLAYGYRVRELEGFIAQARADAPADIRSGGDAGAPDATDRP